VLRWQALPNVPFPLIQCSDEKSYHYFNPISRSDISSLDFAFELVQYSSSICSYRYVNFFPVPEFLYLHLHRDDSAGHYSKDSTVMFY
jgi:hypothetical protein